MLRNWVKWSAAVSLYIVFASTANALGDSELNRLLAQLDSAANNRDAAAVAKVLSDAAQIIVGVPAPRGPSQVTLHKGQYPRMLEQGWNSIGPSYRYSRITTEIENGWAVIVKVVDRRHVEGAAIPRPRIRGVTPVARMESSDA